MRASVLVGVGRMEVRDAPEPRPGPRDVLVDMSSVGLCGTDFHIYSGETNLNLDARGEPVPLEREPQVLGHEITGVVRRVGDEVADLHPGDRVVMDQGINCRSAERVPHCEYCATGNTHQCAQYLEHGITGLQGGLAERLALPAVNAVRIDSDLSPAEAALTEPLGCVLHATDFAERAAARWAVAPDDRARRARTVVVCGAGPAGLLFLQVLRDVLGFDGELIVSELDPKKRALAERHGATAVDPRAHDLVQEVIDRTDGRMAEYVVEATGSGHVLEVVPRLMRKQATLVLYGLGHGGASLELLNQVQWKEPTLITTVGASGGLDADGRPAVYRRALRLLEEGTIDVGPMITHRYEGLDAVPGAFGGDHEQAGYVKGVALL